MHVQGGGAGPHASSDTHTLSHTPCTRLFLVHVGGAQGCEGSRPSKQPGSAATSNRRVCVGRIPQADNGGGGNCGTKLTTAKMARAKWFLVVGSVMIKYFQGRNLAYHGNPIVVAFGFCSTLYTPDIGSGVPRDQSRHSGSCVSIDSQYEGSTTLPIEMMRNSVVGMLISRAISSTTELVSAVTQSTT